MKSDSFVCENMFVLLSVNSSFFSVKVVRAVNCCVLIPSFLCWIPEEQSGLENRQS